jgi:hypothetical protein
MSATITRDEWLTELERVMRQRRPQSGGMTSEELAQMWGCCRAVARLRLQMLRGRLVVGRRSIPGIDGKDNSAPTYALGPAPAARVPKRRDMLTTTDRSAPRRAAKRR